MLIKKIFISDVEGPLSKNDNALEVTQHFIPEGDKLFSLLSKFDDYLADIKKEPNYKAGDTLRLILPFYKAFDISNSSIESFSAENLLLVPGAKETVAEIQEVIPLYLVSTSYRPYINSLCRALNIPKERSYCTELDLDRYEMEGPEKNKILKIKEKICQMPMIEFDAQCSTPEEIETCHLKTIDSLYEIFWHILPLQPISGALLNEINPIGGKEKARALEKILTKEQVRFQNVIYVGDSITDIEALKMVREMGGLSISFNGNAYPFRFAELAIISTDTHPLSEIANIFADGGKKAVYKTIKEVNEAQEKNAIFSVTEENQEALIEKSQQMRKAVRGEKIAFLG
jgi:predicted HAD superfamily phosphohydrolase